MDRNTFVEHHLALAEKHVAQAQAVVEQQRRIVAELRRDGHDSMLSRQILATLEQTLVLHIEDRDRLIKELASLERSSGTKSGGA
jgi:hypothetical protein